MANHQAALAAFFLFVLAVFSNFELSASSLVCGNVSCLDCHSDFDFSGLLVSLAELLAFTSSHFVFKLIL
ncbi:unnamed protein product [Brassica rapa]|uniref:Uncharacterized protein n=1 Tax=Brassica campestris TaxID=3711 RepID=A0A3P6D6E0_BRACM|nr:unnamed protein product [Brassica rapa]VDD18501.1 unnamed protein product [Brassica rapa]